MKFVAGSDKKTPVNPDLQGMGTDLLDTFHIIQNKEFHAVFFKADLNYKFSENFEYPIVIIFARSESAVVSLAVAIDIPQTKGQKELIEETFIAPVVCEALTREELITYFAAIIIHNTAFSYYIDQKPEQFDSCRFINLKPEQQLVLNEHLTLAIIKILDERDRDNKA